MSKYDAEFYKSWVTLLEWMQDYAARHEQVTFVKQADFPDYIYRMERPYDLPTTIMNASLSDSRNNPVLMLSVSPRHTVFKEVTLHPFGTHIYRKLSYQPEKQALAEGKRVFTREMFDALANDLFGVTS